MSHNISYRDYAENVDRAKVKADLDHYVSMEDWQEGCSGLYHPIRWLDSHPICGSSEEAEERIKELDRGDYDNLAVRYYVKREITAATYEKACRAVDNAQKAYNELKKKVEADFHNQKSELIGCKKCGSKLSHKYLDKPVCPPCRNGLLSPTAETRLQNAKAKIAAAQQKQKEERDKVTKRMQKFQKGAEVRWLVKFEYHT